MIALDPDRVVVVAGNGPSLATPAPGRILATDFLIRTNNFFAEPEFFLGRRVDLVLVKGVPRVMPFVLEGIRQAMRHYQVLGWTAGHPRQARIGQRHLRLPHEEMRFATPALAARVAEILAEERLQATSGVLAMYLAHAMGARRIVLTGIDLYRGGARYTYEPGPQMRAVLGADVGRRGYDVRFHSAELDLRLIALLRDQPGVTLLRAGPSPALEGVLDLAPERVGPAPDRQIKSSRERTTDWPSRAGLYPFWLLRLLLWGRAMQRRLLKQGTARS